jgi:hypothetical protein
VAGCLYSVYSVKLLQESLLANVGVQLKLSLDAGSAERNGG